MRTLRSLTGRRALHPDQAQGPCHSQGPLLILEASPTAGIAGVLDGFWNKTRDLRISERLTTRLKMGQVCERVIRPRLYAGVMLLVAAVALIGCGGPVQEGRELEAQGDYAGAVSLYQAALLDDPDNVEVLAALGADLMLLGQWDEALPVQEKTVSLDSEDVQTRIELGFNYLNHQGRPADAARVLAEAASLDPTAQHLTFLAQAQIRAGDGSAAERTLREALDTDPKYAYSYRVLHSFLASQGRVDDAAGLREEALAHGVQLDAE